MSFLGVNWAGVSAALSLAIRPVRPALSVPDITRLDWAALRRKGVTGVVVDKDNCLTKPHEDVLVPRLKASWDSLLKEFGPENVLIVSNSAGTGKDSLLLQAESVSRHLGVPVLVHRHPKPSVKCAKSILAYFLPRPTPPPQHFWSRFTRRSEEGGAVVWSRKVDEGRSRTTPATLLVIGDRLTTDVVLATHLAKLSPQLLTASAILTTSLHSREGPGTTFMRALEALYLLLRFRHAPSVPTWNSCVLPPLEPFLPSVPLANRLSPTPFFRSLLAVWNVPSNTSSRQATSLVDAWRTPFGVLEETAEKAVSKVDAALERVRERGALYSIRLGRWW